MQDNEVQVLLIEDNPSDVELTIRALRKSNFMNTVHVVTDGEEALEYMFGTGKYEGRDIQNRPKLILLDIKLPKVDGLEVLEKMKSHELTKVIPVVILTSSKEERDVIESYKLGVNSYIVKPVDFDKFVEAVSHVGFYWMLLNEIPKP
jgi:CheY-like chemotaxis protein